MCLYSKNRFPRIAWKPIKVYKIVRFKDGDYYTPYYDYKLKHKNLVNIFNTLLSIIVKIKKVWSFKYQKIIYKVNNGFFHSFYDKTTAIDGIDYLKSSGPKINYILIECTIPKFSLYYKGELEDICSNRLNTEFKII